MTTTTRWAGLALTGLVTLFLLADGVTSLVLPRSLAEEMTATGWPLWTGPVVGAIAILAALVYAVPRTAVLGAILVTGFLGGAISAHLRLGDLGSPPQLVCLAAGVAAWAGLWFRNTQVRALLPLG